MPSILVETGFLNHPAEREFLMSDSGRDYLASAIFRAFGAYRKKVESRSSFNLITESNAEQSLSTSAGYSPENQNATQPVTDEVCFSVQIASLSKPVETHAKNFKNENNIFMHNEGQVYRYFSGKYNTVEKAREEQKRLQKKFNGAFVVAFVNNELVPVETAFQKK